MTLFDNVEQMTYEQRIANGETVRALWWKQPFASLMLRGKTETRSRGTNVRGLVLVCSTIRCYNEKELLTISGYDNVSRICRDLPGFDLRNMDALPAGQAIGVGELMGSWQMAKSDEILSYVTYDPARWCWYFDNVRPIEPFELPGKQGWSIIDNETRNKIKFL